MPPAGNARTLVDKIWDAHLIGTHADGRDLLYIDRVMMDEVRAPEAIRLLETSGRAMRRPDLTFATIDHTVETAPGRARADAPGVAERAAALRAAAQRHDFAFFDLGSAEEGISHVVAPEIGLVLPGATHVCSDSHAATVGALGALAFGCGTTELSAVLATQVLALEKPPVLLVQLDGTLAAGVEAKDVALFILATIGIHGARGCVVEYRGPVVDAMSMDGRFTLCNMTIEMGARSAIVAPDATTFAWLQSRPWGYADAIRDRAHAAWIELSSDADACFARTLAFACDAIGPQISWGTDPSMSIEIGAAVPDPALADPQRRAVLERALVYMDLRPGDRLVGRPVERVFIGSCTNARLADLASAAQVVRGRRVAPGVHAIVVPGSAAVKRAAEAIGLDAVFAAAGFAWHESGCSMCSAGSADFAQPGQRCASTSNRNFEHRQGRDVRTHLVSPASAAAAAIAGCFVDVRAR